MRDCSKYVVLTFLQTIPFYPNFDINNHINLTFNAIFQPL